MYGYNAERCKNLGEELTPIYKWQGPACHTFKGLKSSFGSFLGCISLKMSTTKLGQLKLCQDIMYYFRIGISKCWKEFQATPTKQYLGTS